MYCGPPCCKGRCGSACPPRRSGGTCGRPRSSCGLPSNCAWAASRRKRPCRPGRPNRRQGVPVVGRGDDHGIDLFPVEDLAEVLNRLWRRARLPPGHLGRDGLGAGRSTLAIQAIRQSPRLRKPSTTGRPGRRRRSIPRRPSRLRRSADRSSVCKDRCPGRRAQPEMHRVLQKFASRDAVRGPVYRTSGLHGSAHS